MDTERRYPVAFKFAIVALMGFAVVVFYRSSSMIIRLFAVIEFIAALNGWTASEDDSISYGDLYLLIDAFCLALYFLTLLELADGSYEHFFLFSSLIFIFYFLWNILLESQDAKLKATLHKYQVCNISSIVYSLIVFILQKVMSNSFIIYLQYVGMIIWIAVLTVWYYDFYIKNFRQSKDYSSAKN